MRRLLTLFSIVLLTGWLSAQAGTDSLLRSLRPTGHVNDFAGVISAGDRSATEQLLTELEQKTGAQVAVVTLKSLDGGQIADFSTRLFERWGIGQKGKDNGILLLGAIGEGRGNRLRIEVGYGLEGVIPDAVAGRILDRYILPGWNQGQYGTALATGAAAIAQRIAVDQGIALSGVPERIRQASREQSFPWFNLILLLIFIPFAIRHPWILLLLLSSGGGARGGGFGGGGFGGFGGGMSGGGGASR